MTNFQRAVREKMVMAIMTNGHDQQEADQLADANLDACEVVAQAALDAAIDDMVNDCGYPHHEAPALCAPAGLGAAWNWAKTNIT